MRRDRTARSRARPVGSSRSEHRLIRESWARCRAAGVDPAGTGVLRVSDAELDRRRMEAADWLPIAREHVLSVSSLLGELPHALVLADRDAILLHCTAHGSIDVLASELLPGVDLSEQAMGTSGAGTAAACGLPVVVSGAEHFREALRGYTCTAAPLHGPDGTLRGVASLVTATATGVPGRFALVRYLARSVERELAGASRLRGALERSVAEMEDARRQAEEREEQFRILADTIPHLAWMADEGGWIFWYNQRWYDYTGLTLADAQGWGWQRAHHPEHVARVVERITMAWQSGEPWEDTFPLRGADGQYRWFLSRALPVRDAAGQVVRWFGTNTDITAQIESEHELRRAQQELERLYRQAESAVQDREEAVAVVSHDLRAPLSVLGMAAHLLLEPKLSPEQKQAQAEAVAIVVGQMSRLVSDLLDLTRARAGRLQLQRTTIAAEQLLRAAEQHASPLARAAGIELVVEVGPEVGSIGADPARMLQVFANLVDNAVQHSRARGRITLRAERTEQGVRFEVADTGTGIPAEDLPHIFERFWQGPRGHSGGAGLGLSICKGIIDAHGGAISASSTPGQGTTFSFVIPAAPTPSEGGAAVLSGAPAASA